MFFDEMAEQVDAKKGQFCPGDSGDLSFVPSNAFDLVYTGHITPVSDPLYFDLGNDDELSDRLEEICSESDWRDDSSLPYDNDAF